LSAAQEQEAPIRDVGRGRAVTALRQTNAAAVRQGLARAGIASDNRAMTALSGLPFIKVKGLSSERHDSA
jgi:hypothetical protein